MDYISILFLLALGRGEPADLASYIGPQDYFKFRGVAVSVDKMMELAGQEPKDGKGELTRLLALRVLGDDPEGVKKANRHDQAVKLLEQIAAGKKAPDPFGFAQEYAAWAQARLEGKEFKAPARKKRDRFDELRMFPVDAAMVMGLRLDGPTIPPQTAKTLAPLFQLMMVSMRDRDKEVFFGFAEAVGNLRLEGFAVAFLENPERKGRENGCLRFSGKGDHKRMRDFFSKNSRPAGKEDKVPPMRELKDARGKPVTIFHQRWQTIGLFGDTDLVMVMDDFDGKGNLIEKFLALHDGNGFNFVNGLLKGDLEKLPEKVSGYLVGEIPHSLARELTGSKVFTLLPIKATGAIVPGKNGSEIRLTGTFANAGAAKTFAEEADRLKDKATQALKEEAKIPQEFKSALQKTLAGLKIQPDGSETTGQMVVGPELVRGFIQMVTLQEAQRMENRKKFEEKIKVEIKEKKDEK